ncbi:putative ATP synthase F0, A subunit [Fructobacillus pseudoficulneus]|uniref:Putative ATP synthase F0, A subunit n=1 Tax=Fructobacillus pseudoficulneus TaxID=220714 RepID=A0A3F3H761_9LACO|nr:hypothetical protein [Fructobacillus pseudoficulneus]GAP02333.1 putative ATP synthase F0, A subunit [Fructobacillus pseudoficulneus]SEH36400.1 hypothetical protein SAMN05660469_0285 [Fructobacillus pseudoficulneus]
MFYLEKIFHGKKIDKRVLNGLLIILLAGISVIPAFAGHFYSLSFDGIFHLDRLANVTQSFKEGKIPSLFNFAYAPVNSQPGVAINAMYPWVSGLIFVVPALVVKNQLIALAIGFFFMNALTIINAKALMSFFTKRDLYIWLGVIVYQFNNFHFVDLYSRTAIGEAFGYAWMPLVLLGLLKIKEHSKVGPWILGFAVGMIINSHVLSIVFAVIFIGLFELLQIIKRNFDLTHVKNLLIAVLVAILIGGYTLYNIAMLYLNAKFLEPGHFLVSIDPVQFFDALIQNDMSEKPYWTYGLPLVLVQLVLTVIAWNTDKFSEWKSWLVGANIVTLLMFSWLPWDKLQSTPLTLLQFLARLQVIIVLLLTVAIVIYFARSKQNKQYKILILELFVCLFSLVGTYQMHRAYVQTPPHYNLTSKNYYHTLNTAMTAIDYLPVDKATGKPMGVGDSVKTFSTDNYKEIKRTSDSVEYLITTSKSQTVTLPAVMYDGFKYDILLDGKNVNSQMTNLVKINVSEGKHTLVLKTVDSRNYALFYLSMLSIIITTLVMLKLKRY